MQKLPKKIHIIGICGVATSALAIALHKRGVRVTGSDRGFYPPVSTYLTEAGISYYAGWHPEKMVSDGIPDLIIVGGTGTSPSNPEAIYAKDAQIPFLSFAEALGRFVIRGRSVVITGTWGKTTTSALLSYILIQGGFDPSYFTGGLSLSHDTCAITSSDMSIVEGDEYQVSISDRRPKFVYYAPTHVLLTSVSWDHADLYPTEDAYFDTFRKMLGEIPADGMVVVCADDAGVNRLLNSMDPEKLPNIIKYGKSSIANYIYHSVKTSQGGLDLTVSCGGSEYHLSSPMFGRFNAENITAAFAMAHAMGMPADKIISAIKSFKGIKRRFEKRLDGYVTIFDCHAPTADKALSVLESIREVYSKEKIWVVYEPNIGGRQRASISAYDHAFKDADTVIIPRLTRLKVTEDAITQPMEGEELTTTIAKTHPDTISIDDDTKLIEYITSKAKKGDVIAFLGSHGFRGMIEEVVRKSTIRT